MDEQGVHEQVAGPHAIGQVAGSDKLIPQVAEHIALDLRPADAEAPHRQDHPRADGPEADIGAPLTERLDDFVNEEAPHDHQGSSPPVSGEPNSDRK